MSNFNANIGTVKLLLKDAINNSLNSIGYADRNIIARAMRTILISEGIESTMPKINSLIDNMIVDGELVTTSLNVNGRNIINLGVSI